MIRTIWNDPDRFRRATSLTNSKVTTWPSDGAVRNADRGLLPHYRTY